MITTYRTEFPDYDDQLTAPAGWDDTSWKNDICPSFAYPAGVDFDQPYLRLWCDYANPARRELSAEGPRFGMYMHNPQTDAEATAWEGDAFPTVAELQAAVVAFHAWAPTG